MAPITRSATRKTFKFSSLPTELRLMVWRESFEPRILHITREQTLLPDPTRPLYSSRPFPTHIRFKSRKKAPIALQICHESRALALKYYIPSFHSCTSPPDAVSEKKPTAIYFNPDLDIVHTLEGVYGTQLWNLTSKVRRETIESIKMLAIGSRFYQNQLTDYGVGRLSWFKSLETLILVVERGAGRNRGELIQQRMEELLDKAGWEEGKLPVVKVMTRRDFEDHLNVRYR